jgi:arginine:agmatine antiporter
MLRERKIGPALATVLVANNMIGSGIFLLPASLAAIGSMTTIAWVIGLAGALLVAAVFARLGQAAPQAGGPCAYAGAAFGPYIGFQADVIYWLSGWIGTAAIALTVVGYLASFVPALGAPAARTAAAIAIIWALTLLNVMGPRLVCQLNSLMLVAGLLPIALVATLGWWHFDSRIFWSSWNVTQQPASAVLPASLALVFWAFLGLESASVASAIVVRPQRNVPIATVCGVLLAGVVYFASSTAIMGIVPAAALARSTAPFADAVRVMSGPAIAGIVGLMALCKAVSTLAGWILLLGEIGKAAAERRHLPSFFARTDRHGVPVRNLLLSAALMSGVLLATLSPTLSEQFDEIAAMTVDLSLLLYVYACGATWHYAAASPTDRGLQRYRAIAAAAILFCLAVMMLSGTAVLATAVALALGTLPLYVLLRRSSARRGVPQWIGRSNSRQ